jgi:hypothetical protein
MRFFWEKIPRAMSYKKIYTIKKEIIVIAEKIEGNTLSIWEIKYGRR